MMHEARKIWLTMTDSGGFGLETKGADWLGRGPGEPFGVTELFHVTNGVVVSLMSPFFIPY